MISYWWNLNSAFHVPPRPVVRGSGGGGGKECNFRTNRQGSSRQRERGMRGKRDTGVLLKQFLCWYGFLSKECSINDLFSDLRKGFICAGWAAPTI
jgi:hypothetical protein